MWEMDTIYCGKVQRMWKEFHMAWKCGCVYFCCCMNVLGPMTASWSWRTGHVQSCVRDRHVLVLMLLPLPHPPLFLLFSLQHPPCLSVRLLAVTLCHLGHHANCTVYHNIVIRLNVILFPPERQQVRKETFQIIVSAVSVGGLSLCT